MSAYDNPTIIQDLYGSKAWAAAAGQVTQAVNSGLEAMAKNREKQADIVAAKQKMYNKSYVQAEIKQTELANTNFSLMESEGKPAGLIEQAQQLSEYEMYGGVHTYNGVEKDYGIGSIKAMAEVNANLTLDPDLRKKYLKLANEQKANLTNASKEGALVLTDEKTAQAVLSGDPKSYWFGDSEEEKYTNYLVASGLYNKEIGGGVEITKKYNREQVKGKSNSILDVQIKIPVGSVQAEAYKEGEGFKKGVNVKDGNIIIDWKRNLTDGSWDGNLAQTTTVEAIDYNAINKDNGSIVNGELSKAYKHQLTGTVTKGDTQDQKEILTFVNVDGFINGADKTIQARADTLAQMALTGSKDDKGDVYHYLESIGYAGINYAQGVEDGTVSKETVSTAFKQYIQQDMLSHYNLGQERDGEGKFVNQKVNGLALSTRTINQDQIDELEKNGVDVSNIKAGTEQYFYVDAKSTDKETSNNFRNSRNKTVEEILFRNISKKIKSGNLDAFNSIQSTPGGKSFYKNFPALGGDSSGVYEVNSDGDKAIGAQPVPSSILQSIYSVYN